MYDIVALIIELLVFMGIPYTTYRLLRRMLLPRLCVASVEYFGRSHKRIRLLIQNQNDYKLDGEIVVTLPIPKNEWYKSQDGAKHSVSIVHGPGVKESGITVCFEKSHAIITFIEGLLPLTTWLIICRTNNYSLKAVQLSYYYEKSSSPIKQEFILPGEMKKQSLWRKVVTYEIYMIFYYLLCVCVAGVVFGKIWAAGLTVKIVATKNIIALMTSLLFSTPGVYIIFGLILTIVFTAFATFISKAEEIAVIQGYQYEDDDVTVSHFNCE